MSIEQFHLQKEVLDHLLTIQGGFKESLLKNVETFQHDTSQFYSAYAEVSRGTIINTNQLLSIIQHNLCEMYMYGLSFFLSCRVDPLCQV